MRYEVRVQSKKSQKWVPRNSWHNEGLALKMASCVHSNTGSKVQVLDTKTGYVVQFLGKGG